MARRPRNSEQTRARILDAAFDCLVEVGYAGTSTVAVCRKAEVARGTFLHHFATRQDLLFALLDEVLDRRLESFRLELAGETDVSFRFILELLWREFSAPVFWAWLELVNASRTEPHLRERVGQLLIHFEAKLTLLVVDVVDLHRLSSSVTPLMVATVLSGLVGVAMDRLVKSPEEVEARAALMIAWGTSQIEQ